MKVRMGKGEKKEREGGRTRYSVLDCYLCLELINYVLINYIFFWSLHFALHSSISIRFTFSVLQLGSF